MLEEGTHELMRTGPTFGATGAVDGCTRWPLELINRGRRAAGPGEGMRGGGRTEGARASGLAATRGARGRTRTNGRFSFALLLPAPLCQLLLSLPVTRYPRPRDSRGEAIRGSSLQVPECNASLAVRSPQYIHLAGDASYFDDVETLQPRRTGQPGAQCSTRRPAQSIRRQPRARRALFAIADDTRGHMGARRRGKAIAAHGDKEEPATRTRWSRSRTTSRSSSSDSESSTAARPAWERSGPFRRGSSDRAFTSERLRDHRGEDASSSPDESSLSSDAEEGIQGVARPLLSSSGRNSDASLRAPGDARGREERRNSRTKVSAPTCASLLSLLFPLSLGAEALNDRFRQQGRPA